MSSTESPHGFDKIIWKLGWVVSFFHIKKVFLNQKKYKVARQMLTYLKETISKCYVIIYIKVCIVSSNEHWFY